MEKKEELNQRLLDLLSRVNIEGKKQKVQELEQETYKENFWQEHEGASDVMKQIALLKKQIDDIEFAQLCLMEDDLVQAEKIIKEYEVFIFLSGPYDEGNTIFTIHAGQGGTEAMDWTSMLYRMYTRYFERKGFKYHEVDRIEGEEAGIKSVTVNVEGNFSFGYLKNEAGVHRLVRISPFNANKLRQTSFALVEVLPIIKDAEVDIKPEDLEWDFFRAGGHGGQNVNKVSSAVRLKHIPSGIIVTCQQERQQEQNRENALKILRGKLWQIKEEAKDKQISDLKTVKMASWGLQIRSYVLHPYKLIKDLRTDYERTDTDNVLDGDLDDYIKANLIHTATKQG
jgi:peptide chain release factor 2